MNRHWLLGLPALALAGCVVAPAPGEVVVPPPAYAPPVAVAPPPPPVVVYGTVPIYRPYYPRPPGWGYPYYGPRPYYPYRPYYRRW